MLHLYIFCTVVLYSYTYTYNYICTHAIYKYICVFMCIGNRRCSCISLYVGYYCINLNSHTCCKAVNGEWTLCVCWYKDSSCVSSHLFSRVVSCVGSCVIRGCGLTLEDSLLCNRRNDELLRTCSVDSPLCAHCCGLIVWIHLLETSCGFIA